MDGLSGDDGGGGSWPVKELVSTSKHAQSSAAARHGMQASVKGSVGRLPHANTVSSKTRLCALQASVCTKVAPSDPDSLMKAAALLTAHIP